ncbi:pyrroline-5-carboxylate reductase [Staphylococcus equorum]|uniref:Pyrroline-5-carboxylate reductase n=1 Tax=Staphylococcus equorum TaxID=246432 RepID=A0A9X4R0J7_9STAP|nr:pyrroline-5-carboxylate reductase [Staphylococcus equorum]MDG0841979.1 pyrroline-5-carboxylate reductase [Staphylococcus equorum]MDG0857969.1 pyrroline-5-carboxylate reductase [Staphylococcus equorum]
MKIGIIGAGSMGSAMIKGFYKSNHLNMNEIYIKSGKSNKAKMLAERVNANVIHTYNDLEKSDMLILMVNESDAREILENLSEITNKNTIIVSVVPSFTIEELEGVFPEEQPIVSLLPNTVVEINQGILGYAHNQYVDEASIEFVFKPLGNLIKVNENELGIFSTLSGCGPAMVDVFIEGLSDGAVLNGMNRALSYEVITEMLIGAAKLAQASDKHTAELKDEVTSPGGSTIKTIAKLEKHAFRYTLVDAINAVNNKN